MACPLCISDPDSHCFVKFGTIAGVDLVYTAPSRTKVIVENEYNILNFKLHIDSEKGRPWIWILDCRGMKMKHYASIKFTMRIANILVNEHRDFLQEIIILHANDWIRSLLIICKKVFNEGIMKRVNILQGEKVELYLTLQAKGISGPPLQWLTAVFMTLPEPGHLPALT